MVLPSDILPDQLKTRTVQIRFSPADVDRLREIKQALGFRTISEMIRVSLAEGLPVISQKVKRPLP
jgi:hypothetical protein